MQRVTWALQLTERFTLRFSSVNDQNELVGGFTAFGSFSMHAMCYDSSLFDYLFSFKDINLYQKAEGKVFFNLFCG